MSRLSALWDDVPVIRLNPSGMYRGFVIEYVHRSMFSQVFIATLVGSDGEVTLKQVEALHFSGIIDAIDEVWEEVNAIGNTN